MTTTAGSLLIRPARGPLNATVRVPGSKSLTNRALLVAALAEGRTCLTNALFSDDSRYFAAALQHLGFEVALDEASSTMAVRGLGGRIPAERADLFVGNAGTAARFLTAMLALGQGEYVVDGNDRMRERPIAELVDGLNQLGAQASAPTGCPPVHLRAAGLRGGQARVRGVTSSQYLSGLLLASPYARAPVDLAVRGDLSSRPYVDLTLAVMADFGVQVERDGYAHFHVRPQRYQARASYLIESDASAASYFFAAPAVAGGTVRVQGLSRRARQGDIAFLDVLVAMGCAVESGPDWVAVTAPAGGLRGIAVGLGDIPDTAQTLAAIAPFASGPTTISGIASARVKETDRIAATCTELRRLGVRVDEFAGGLRIYPAVALRPARVETYDDHRMAMAFALVGLRVPGIEIIGAGCVSKTFPAFFDVLASLHAPV